MENIIRCQNKKSLGRVGYIFSSYALFATTIGALCYLGVIISAILSVVLYIFLIFAVICTLGLILLNSSFKGLFSHSGDNLNNFFALLNSIVPYLFAFGAITAVLGFIFTLFDLPGNNKKKNIIKSIICFILCGIGFIFSLAIK